MVGKGISGLRIWNHTDHEGLDKNKSWEILSDAISVSDCLCMKPDLK